MKKIKDYLESLEMPEWGYISEVNVEGSVINIRYCDMATIYFDTEWGCECGLTIEKGALGKWDLEFVLDVLDNREEIISLMDKAA